MLLLLILMRRDAAAATCRNNRRLAKAEGDCEVEVVVTALEVFMLLSSSLRTVTTYGSMASNCAVESWAQSRLVSAVANGDDICVVRVFRP